MNRVFLSLGLVFCVLTVKAQFIGMANNSFVPGDFYTSFYRTNSPLNTIGNRMEIIEWKDSCRNVRWYSPAIKLVAIAGQTSGSVPGNIVWLDSNDSGRIKVSNTLSASVINNSLGYTAGDISSSGSYSNPSWITGLAYSKLTGTPTIPSTTTQISEGTNLYYTDARSRSALSITTTGTSGAATYNSGTGILNIPNYTSSSGTVTSVGLSSTDLSISGSPITTSGAITANLTTTGVSAGTYGSRITVDTKGRVTSAQNRVFNSVSRTLSTTGTNNTFTISATRDAYVNYTISFSVALLAALSNAVVDLDYSLDGGTNWVNVSSVSQVFGVSITITTTQRSALAGWIPAGALVRIYNSTNTNATTTLVANRQQEMLD